MTKNNYVVSSLFNKILKDYKDEKQKNSFQNHEQYYRQRSLELLVRKKFSIIYDNGNEIVILLKNERLYQAHLNGSIFEKPVLVKNFGAVTCEIFSDFLEKVKYSRYLSQEARKRRR